MTHLLIIEKNNTKGVPTREVHSLSENDTFGRFTLRYDGKHQHSLERIDIQSNHKADLKKKLDNIDHVSRERQKDLDLCEKDLNDLVKKSRKEALSSDEKDTRDKLEGICRNHNAKLEELKTSKDSADTDIKYTVITTTVRHELVLGRSVYYEGIQTTFTLLKRKAKLKKKTMVSMKTVHKTGVPKPQYLVGDQIWAYYQGSKSKRTYPGTIMEHIANGIYKVQFEDGDKDDVIKDHIFYERPSDPEIKGAKFKRDQVVWAPFNGAGRYRGQINHVIDATTYHIHFDDNDHADIHVDDISLTKEGQ